MSMSSAANATGDGPPFDGSRYFWWFFNNCPQKPLAPSSPSDRAHPRLLLIRCARQSAFVGPLLFRHSFSSPHLFFVAWLIVISLMGFAPVSPWGTLLRPSAFPETRRDKAGQRPHCRPTIFRGCRVSLIVSDNAEKDPGDAIHRDTVADGS